MRKSGRYDTSKLVEAQFEPGSRGRVLKNLIGVKGIREMEEAESEALTTTTDKLLGMYDKDYQFKENDIKFLHKLWLGGIYKWAGSYRLVNVSKEDLTFAAAKQIPLLMVEFEKGPLRRHTPCNFKTQKRIIQALSEVHIEFVLIHPFREGNGRVARILSTLMAAQAGLPILDFIDITGKKREEYFSAINRGLNRDYKPMEEIFSCIIERSLQAKTGGRI